MELAAVQVSLPSFAASQLVGYVLVLSRVGGLFVLAPIFSARLIPTQAKLVVAGAISFALMPLVTSGVTVPTDISVAPLILKELLTGLAIALGLAVVSAGIQAAASVLDVAIGFSFAELVDPLMQGQSAVIGQFYSLFSVLVFLLIGGDRLMIQGLVASYRLVPLGTVPSFAQVGGLAENDLVQIALIGMEVAAPVLIALGLVDITLALVARTVPQINVFIVGLPGKILVGIGAISASLPFITGHVQDMLQQAVYQALIALRVH
ncbi:MAG TPA: flagellar biosynthetic protein FliR [Gaiellaceae bacterium]|nr:flagellar biosynthetic protein FliR [Gaiellaceae bacterium]